MSGAAAGSVPATVAHSGAAIAGQRIAGTSIIPTASRRTSSGAADSPATARARARRRARATRRLRTLVVRDRGCLSSLAPGQQRLLALRAGLGDERSLSATAVARIIHVSAMREARLERTALHDLRAQARHGCRASMVATSLATLSGTQRAEMVGWVSPVAGSGLATASGSGASGSGAGGSLTESGGVTRGSAKTRSHGTSSSHQTNEAAVNVTPVSAGDSLLPIVLGVLALGAVALLLVAVQQYRLRAAMNPGGVYSRPLPPPPPRAQAGPDTAAGGGAAGAEPAPSGGAAGPGPTGGSAADAGSRAPTPPPSPAPAAPAPRRPGNQAGQAALLASVSAGFMRLVGRAASRHRRGGRS